MSACDDEQGSVESPYRLGITKGYSQSNEKQGTISLNVFVGKEEPGSESGQDMENLGYSDKQTTLS